MYDDYFLDTLNFFYFHVLVKLFIWNYFFNLEQRIHYFRTELVKRRQPNDFKNIKSNTNDNFIEKMKEKKNAEFFRYFI